MSSKWIIGLAFLFILGTVICCVLDLAAPLPSAANCAVHKTATCYLWDGINNFKLVTNPAGSNFLGQAWSVITGIITGIGAWLIALGHMFIWDYSFFEGAYNIIRWVVFMPLSFGLGWTLITYVIGVIRGIV